MERCTAGGKVEMAPIPTALWFSEGPPWRRAFRYLWRAGLHAGRQRPLLGADVADYVTVKFM